MSKIIKGILIDPENCEISEVSIPFDDEGSCLQGMYEALNCTAVDCGRGGLKFLPSSPSDDVWFDDEGLYSDCKAMFKLPEWVPLVGRGLILGFDDEGECVDHHLTAEDIEALKLYIKWGRRWS